MGKVRIKVFGADGKYRGGFHRDDVAAPHRWIGRTQANLSEVIVCDGAPSSGSWLLLEYKLPRQFEGEEGQDNPIDEVSRCCERTVPQALLWFISQDSGAPPALVERARRFAIDWSAFRSSAPRIALLEQLSHRQFTPCDHPAVRGDRGEDIRMLERLELVGSSKGHTPSICVASLVSDVGVRQFIEWMDRHVNAVADFLAIPALEPTSAATHVATPSKPSEWYQLAEHVERAYDLMGSYSGLLRHPHSSDLDTDIEWSIWQIEVVMRRWLPQALASGDPLIEKVHRLIGSHREAKQTIDESDRSASRIQCLRSIAERAHPKQTPVHDLLAFCREDLLVWRSLLPDQWLSGVGPMRLTLEQRGHMHAPAFYWSMDFDRRCSWEGAAYLLAAGCESMSKMATEMGLTTERLRTTLRLALRLREFPGWSSIDDLEIDKFVREQIDLARDFEEVVTEVSLLASIKHPRRPEGLSAIEGPGPEAAAPKSTPRVPHGDNGRRPKRDVIDSVARLALKTALEAAAENGTSYIPERKAIARTVSTQLEFHIGVSSLFATEQRGGMRVHRYSSFIELWQQTNKHSEDAARHARAKGKAEVRQRRRPDDE